MDVTLRPNPAARPTGADPGFLTDDLLDRAWRDPWGRATCRRIAAAWQPGTAFLDDDTLLAQLKHHVRAGALTVSAAAPAPGQGDPNRIRPNKPQRYPAMIEAFAKGKGNGAFPNIPREQVVLGLRIRTAKPGSIYQANTSLCGPSSLLYNLLLDDPDVYVRYVIDLYETGAAMLGKTKVKPGESCRNYNPTGREAPASEPAGGFGRPTTAVSKGITGIDWITTASLRDSDNDVFNYDDPSDKFAGITLPNNLAGWMEGLGYTSVTNETNIFFTKSPEVFDHAARLLRQGQRVCIFVNSRLVAGEEKVSHFYATPDHWVVLHDSDGLQKGTLAATFWTWARLVSVPLKGSMSADTFCGNFFGYVAGSPP